MIDFHIDNSFFPDELTEYLELEIQGKLKPPTVNQCARCNKPKSTRAFIGTDPNNNPVRVEVCEDCQEEFVTEQLRQSTFDDGGDNDAGDSQ